MRDIKFRVWFRETNKMSHKEVLSNQGVACMEYGNFAGSYFPEDAKIMLFTGIRDKNGKDIYEMDIIRYVAKDGYKYLEMNGDIGVIKYVFCSYMIEDMKGSEFLMIYYKDIEVIGNFYENRNILDTEVLKVKA